MQNRLNKVTTDNQSGTVHVVEYTYNNEGIRVKAYSYDMPQGGGAKSNEKTIIYLVDPFNHTGYAQTLEELTYNYADPDPLTETPDSRKTYTIGDDMLTQATGSGAGQHLLYDGHGSTRQLVSGTVGSMTIHDDFSYDGYGVLLQDESVASANPGKTPAQDTSLLYAGEQFDTDLQMYYNRARYYDQNTGRFNRMDPFAGSRQDPQSLHKYLYAHCNPIMNIDPTGKIIGSIADLSLSISIRVMMLWMSYGGVILNALTYATYVTAGLYAASSIALQFIEWGYLPHDQQGFIKAVQYYSGVGFVLSFTALALLSTLPDPRQTARPPQKVPRLARDKAVDGRPAPDLKPTSRPVAQNPAINAEKNRDVLRLNQQGAIQIRVNQRQVRLEDSGFVQKGLNRPDNQGIFENRPSINIEYDTRLDRLMITRDRILANDPEAMIILKWFDGAGNYTIVP